MRFSIDLTLAPRSCYLPRLFRKTPPNGRRRNMVANVLPHAVHDVDIGQSNSQVTPRISPGLDIYSTPALLCALRGGAIRTVESGFSR